MEQTIFKRVFGEGFGSFQKAFNFPLQNAGINMVSGSNGNGKTTIFSVLMYALFGSTLKDTTQPKIATWKRKRKDYFRGVRAGVEFSKGEFDYMVVRHIGFKGNTKGLAGTDRMMVFKKVNMIDTFSESDLVTDEKHKGDMQAYIIEVLGMGDKAFLNSVLFGQRMKRLVESSGDDKRKLFEELFELEWLGIAKQRADAKKETLAGSLMLISKNIATYDQIVSSMQSRIDDGKRILESYKEQHDERVQHCRDVHEKASQALKNLSAKVAKLKPLADKYQKNGDEELRLKRDADGKVYDAAFKAEQSAEQRWTGFDAEIAKCGENIGTLNVKLTGVKLNCPYCGAKLSAAKVKEVKDVIQKEIESERAAIKELETQKELAFNGLGKLKSETVKMQKIYAASKKAYDDYLVSVKTYQEAYNDWTLHIQLHKIQQDGVTAAKADLDMVIAEEPPKVDIVAFEKERDDAKLKSGALTKEKDDLQAEYDRVVWWITKGFSAGGLKAFVFNAMLSQLNLHVDKYAARLGVRVKFSVDLTKASKPFVTTCYFEGDETDYKDLSGGEKQRVDIVLAFAMHDMVQNYTAPTNILIMDEVFEGLDGEGVETVYDLVRMKAEGDKSIYLITHSQLLDSLYTKHFNIEYDTELETSYIAA